MSSSSSSSVSSSNIIRFSGMASGLDTESIVKQLMNAEKIPYTKLGQKKQLLQWTQDAYRAQSTLLMGFKTSYFDVLNGASNMRSAAIYKQFTSTSTNTSVATVSGSTSAGSGTHTLTVSQIATKSKLESAASVSSPSGSIATATAAMADSVVITSGVNDTLTLDVNGNQQTITIAAGTYATNSATNPTGVAAFKSVIQAQLDTKFGSGNVKVDIGADKTISFKKQDNTAATVMASSAAATLGITAKVDLSAGNTFELSIDGGATKKDITMPVPTDNAYDIMDPTKRSLFVNNVQSEIDKQFGSGKINVVLSADNKLLFSTSSSVTSLKIYSGNNVDASKNFDISKWGFNTEGEELAAKVSLNTKLSDLGGTPTPSGSPATTTKFNLKINGVAISIDSGKTVNDLINAVNTSDAGVTMSFNSLTGKFSLETKSTGAATINAFNLDNLVDDGDKAVGATTNKGLLANMGLTKATGISTNGQNSQYTLDGVSMSSSSNTFTQAGVNYTVTGTGTTSVALSQNVDAAVAKIKEFVGKYNDLIAEIQGKLDDKYDRNYQPLTDDQKSAMSDTDIAKWETKAQTGLLHNDSMLEDFLSEMRSAISAPSSSSKWTMASIGITTGAWYDGGKLTVDETKLRTALTSDVDGVTKLFTNESSHPYHPTGLTDTDKKNGLTEAQLAQNNKDRYNENGVITRLYDIINDNVRTTNGKGKLLQKAGTTGDSTEYSNTIYDDIKDITDKMYDMNERLSEKETAYYKKFASLETYMNNMNSQSSWLTQQLSKM